VVTYVLTTPLGFLLSITIGLMLLGRCCLGLKLPVAVGVAVVTAALVYVIFERFLTSGVSCK
jgi:hypothetical protein